MGVYLLLGLIDEITTQRRGKEDPGLAFSCDRCVMSPAAWDVQTSARFFTSHSTFSDLLNLIYVPLSADLSSTELTPLCMTLFSAHSIKNHLL
ncbi:hypothetical protein CHARACLAT_031851 [Characodon lateralis]|uniref:Uncharacterized protein n=1 Tax=Characodon lateralis TaxID=208331 RepID=A0ABU7F7S2_9TELE|nr:hypothetical protein [Characodon lateralis]